jgi:hypothetical protein
MTTTTKPKPEPARLSADEVLRRMLSTPPQPFTPKPKKKTKRAK